MARVAEFPLHLAEAEGKSATQSAAKEQAKGAMNDRAATGATAPTETAVSGVPGGTSRRSRLTALIVACALQRPESRGLHYNLDYPQADPAWAQRDSVVRRAG
jgi:aspartate oxidase